MKSLRSQFQPTLAHKLTGVIMFALVALGVMSWIAVTGSQRIADDGRRLFSESFRQQITARLDHMDALMARLPGAEVLPAVDGRVMSEAERGAICRPVLHRPAYPFPPKPGEIGCFLSHRRAWERIVASGDAAG